ncbi:farnesyl diphosphate synthase [Teredinibacter sp. KSP-S5-2]|uniref:polyprenyl synthetase family protein n=1 Tax=Teredinibacter sp. KSP-S5-2 TaxID=3034506 RepID=UPI0029352E3C|nr:farnesyl diphosphate synthase [Teredinibacter sp. KSP-S5-2]WNO08734.1 polyprenyl synthetase family protein [Teredinibacter sp. KSP-S5-2]
MSTELQDFLTTYQTRSNQLLENHLAGYIKHSHKKLAEAMKYGALMGGKRIRPVLVYAAANALGSINHIADTFACAIEAIHAYSLIHDDLPAMDDDDLRRGQATCHIAFDEATAILAGDALQCMAFELIADDSDIPAGKAIQAIRLLSKAAGAHGMVLGQAIDLEAVDQDISIEALQNMHEHKTGALIEAAVLLGALAADANSEQTHALSRYAKNIGLAFQVQDDILDVTTDTETLGKQQGADASNNKPTYVSLLGLDGAKDKATGLIQAAHEALAPLDNARVLHDLADYIIARNY